MPLTPMQRPPCMTPCATFTPLGQARRLPHSLWAPWSEFLPCFKCHLDQTASDQSQGATIHRGTGRRAGAGLASGICGFMGPLSPPGASEYLPLPDLTGAPQATLAASEEQLATSNGRPHPRAPLPRRAA